MRALQAQEGQLWARPGQADFVPLSPATGSPGLGLVHAPSHAGTWLRQGSTRRRPSPFYYEHTFPSLAISG